MMEASKAAEDLAYVRQAVERRERREKTPLGVPVLWGAIVLAGCVTNDFAYQWSWLYWAVVPTLGFAASWLMGVRQVLRVGEYDARTGIRCGLHWGFLFLAAVPVWLMGIMGRIDGWTMGQLLFLVSGVFWFLAGVHLDRRYALPGLAMVLGAILLIFMQRFAWTTAGLLICVAIIAGFALPRREHE